MPKAFVMTALTTVLAGCAARASAWKGRVEWPTGETARLVGQPLEAGAVLAAAGAVRELVRTNPFPDLFHGCAIPEQGLDVAVFTGPTQGLYYVVLHQRFNRCGGPAVRVLDGWYSYAVTPQGDVVAEAPLDTGEDASPTPAEPPPEAAPPSPTPPAVPAAPTPASSTPPPSVPSADAPAASPPSRPAAPAVEPVP